MLSQPPGSGPDNVARILSDRLAKTWGQAVVIENKPGGQNIVGAQWAARAPAVAGSHHRVDHRITPPPLSAPPGAPSVESEQSQQSQ